MIASMFHITRVCPIGKGRCGFSCIADIPIVHRIITRCTHSTKNKRIGCVSECYTICTLVCLSIISSCYRSPLYQSLVTKGLETDSMIVHHLRLSTSRGNISPSKAIIGKPYMFISHSTSVVSCYTTSCTKYN